ncbi:TadE/TadG family type IV pilus assembly protein [Methylobacterium segetis]|uniref:TadE/TadG family type IV pilus assembly protein n=1 Tax=Methylobacterium segetis TaxID=2488750 RepID=UPI00104C0ACF|nr:TadE/TadG family type IV pilus assembly protein [Methylobacterium segetis]
MPVSAREAGRRPGRRASEEFSRARSTWSAARDGNISILFGLLILPLIGTVGLAIDYGQLLIARTACQTGADSAALYASGVAKTLIQQSDGSATAVAAAFGEAKSRSEALFNAHVARTGKLSVAATVTLTKTGQRIDAAAGYAVSTRTTFGGLFGVRSLSAIGQAVSSASMPLYTDLYMALDVSQSMGLAATKTGAQDLFRLTLKSEKDAGNKSPKGCVFGCHVVQNGSAVPLSYETLARNAGIPLRIDVLRDAVSRTISTAEADARAVGTSNYRIGLYTMGLASANATTSGLVELAPLSTNWASLKTAAAGITLGPNNGGGTGDTFLTEPLNALRGRVPTSGDGNTQAQSRAFLFIITDGLPDVKGACTSGHCTAPFDPAVCQTYKSANVTVGVIYTTFLPILNNPTDGSTALNGDYKNLVLPHADKIAPSLQACASPGWYAEASDGPAIDAALARMFAQTALQPQITN